VNLLAAQDMLAASPGKPGKAGKPPIVSDGERKVAMTNPEFTKVDADDGPGFVAAKKNFQDAKLTNAGAVTGQRLATQDVRVAKAQEGMASGIVDKLDKRWASMEKEAIQKSAGVEVEETSESLDHTIVDVLAAEKGQLANQTAMGLIAPPAPAPAGAAAAAAPQQASYTPLGQSANPFAEEHVAQTQPRFGIGAGMVGQGAARLGPNLQPDGPHVPLPVHAAPPAEEGAAASGEPAAVGLLRSDEEIVMNLPATPLETAAMQSGRYNADLAKAVAASAGVDPRRVRVRKVFTAPFTPIGRVPLPSALAQASKLGHSDSRTSRPGSQLRGERLAQ